MQDAFKYLKAGGGFSMLGIPSEPIAIDVANDIVFKGIQIYGVVGRRIFETWHQVRALIDSKKLHLETNHHPRDADVGNQPSRRNHGLQGKRENRPRFRRAFDG
ncbi:MAG: hypothetical protein MZU97_05410 [Bacillus subtilis]|nr:hypothetical protein [Bacillus subtilis]